MKMLSFFEDICIGDTNASATLGEDFERVIVGDLGFEKMYDNFWRVL